MTNFSTVYPIFEFFAYQVSASVKCVLYSGYKTGPRDETAKFEKIWNGTQKVHERYYSNDFSDMLDAFLQLSLLDRCIILMMDFTECGKMDCKLKGAL